jgi:F0F1-type ATP synthase membrane subunit c/vacuolar-type H+-ATPase subunit K
MLPLIAKQELGLGALGYGVLLGGLGASAILAAIVLPAIRRKVSINLLIVSGTLLFAAVTATLATVHVFPSSAL